MILPLPVQIFSCNSVSQQERHSKHFEDSDLWHPTPAGCLLSSDLIFQAPMPVWPAVSAQSPPRPSSGWGTEPSCGTVLPGPGLSRVWPAAENTGLSTRGNTRELPAVWSYQMSQVRTEDCADLIRTKFSPLSGICKDLPVRELRSLIRC